LTSVQESSLTDIIQANAIGSNTCRILVTTPPGRGVIFIADGEVVDAAYGDFTGEDAFHALINAEVSRTQVSTGLRTPNRRITSGWQALITRAMTLRFDGRLPVPSFPDDRGETEATIVLSRNPAPSPRPEPIAVETAKTAPAPRPEPTAVQTVKAAPKARPRPAATAPSAPAPRRSPAVPIAAGLLLILAAAGGTWLVRGGHPSSAASPAAATAVASSGALPPLAAIEATELKRAGDALPTLLSGDAPRSPNPESALVPTIVCRLLVAEDGSVREASIFQSRLDQASFENAALATVKTYRFHPGRRAGKPVAVWINWPVSFQ
jgi:protein TonB